jgi:hypothetical protein
VVSQLSVDPNGQLMTKLSAVDKVGLLPLKPSGTSDYDRFVAGHPKSLLYYSSRYRSFLEELLGCQSAYWIACEGSDIVGVLPLMRLPGRWGDVLNSLPFFGSNGGILASSAEAEQALLKKFNELSAEGAVAASTWVAHPLAADQLVPDHDLVDERLCHFTELSRNAKILLARIDGSARRNIKKAQASGVTVRVDNDSFGFLEQTHRDNMKSIGGRAKTSRFFDLVQRHFEPGVDYNLYVAEAGGALCAALLLLYFNDTVEYFTPVTVEAMRTNQPMALILFEAMLDSASAGYRRWNWGGTWLTQTGVRRFKQKWGATEGRYRYYTKLNREDLLHQSSTVLAETYPDFFVVPYAALEGI